MGEQRVDTMDGEHPSHITRAYLRYGLPATLSAEQREAWVGYKAGRPVPLRLLLANGDCLYYACPAHGDAACKVCAQTAPGGLDECGGCTECDFYDLSGMHWDTCANRVRIPPIKWPG